MRVILSLILLFAPFVSANKGFSLSSQISYLTGKITLDGREHGFYDFDENVKGGRVLLVFRKNINEYLSLGVGSGTSVSELHAFYSAWGAHNFSAEMFYIPIFGEIRGQFPIYGDFLQIFAAAKLGGSSSPVKERIFSTDYYFEGGFFFEPTLGISFTRNRFLLDFGVGYSRQKSQFVEYFFYDGRYGDKPRKEIDRYPFTIRQFSLNLGFGVFLGKRR